MWIEFARGALTAAVGAHGAPTIDPPVAARLSRILADWESEATRGPELSLTFEIPDEEAEFLAHAFLLVAEQWTAMADERGFDVSPPEGDEFYAALVDGVIAAMEHADDVSAVEFGEALRNVWPRVDRLEPPGEPDGS